MILSLHKKRKVTKFLEFTYQKRVYQIDKKATHVIHKEVTFCDLFGGQQAIVYAGKELGYKVFGKLMPEINHADEKTINFMIDNLWDNPINPGHKLPVDM